MGGLVSTTLSPVLALPMINTTPRFHMCRGVWSQALCLYNRHVTIYLRILLLCDLMQGNVFLIWFLVKGFFSFILHSNHGFPSLLSFHSLSPYLPPIHPLLLYSGRGKPPMTVNKAWHIKFRHNQAPPSASRLGKASQNGE